MAEDKLTKRLTAKEKDEMERKALEEMLKMEEQMKSFTDRELELLYRLEKKAGKKEKDPKPKKDPVTGAEYLYVKKGGLVKKSKSKVAGRLATRGYGKAMKGKK